MPYLSFFDWPILLSILVMSSRFIHVLHKREFTSFLRLNNIPVYAYATFSVSIHLTISIQVVSTAWLL